MNIATISTETGFMTNGTLNPAASLWLSAEITSGFIGDPGGAAVAESELAATVVSAAGACTGTEIELGPRDNGEAAVTDSAAESMLRGKVGIVSVGAAMKVSIGVVVGVAVGVVMGVFV